MILFIKTAGLVLIFLSCALVGSSLSGFLVERVRSLGQLIRMLEALREELRYSREPIKQAIMHTARHTTGCATVFTAAVLEGMSGELPPPESWIIAAGRIGGIDRGDREELASLAAALGGSDLEGQLCAIDGCIRGLEARRSDAAAVRDQWARIYRILGILAGAAAVVIII